MIVNFMGLGRAEHTALFKSAQVARSWALELHEEQVRTEPESQL